MGADTNGHLLHYHWAFVAVWQVIVSPNQWASDRQSCPLTEAVTSCCSLPLFCSPCELDHDELAQVVLSTCVAC